MTRFFKYDLLIFAGYFLLCFPLFYFVYKFGILLEGYDDARSYLRLCEDLGADVPSPFNMRLILPSIVHAMDKLGLYYETQCAIDAFPQVNKRIFFNNLFLNYTFVSTTAFSIFWIFRRLEIPSLLAFCAGILFICGFGTIFYLMMPGVDSLSVLLFTWFLFFYLKRNYACLIFFTLFIFQREYYYLVFGLIGIMDYFKSGKIKFYLAILGASIILFGIYYILRKTVFFTDHWNHQTSPDFLLSSLFDIKIDVVSMARQSLMTMNLFLLYLIIIVCKRARSMHFNSYNLIVSLVLLLQITILSIAATFGNNNGRYFYLLIPMILYFMALEVKPLYAVLLASSGQSPSPDISTDNKQSAH